MFTEIVRIPIRILRIVTIWEIPIGNVKLRRYYNFYRSISRYVFVYIPLILQAIYVATADDFQKLSDGLSFTISYTNVCVKLFLISREWELLSNFTKRMDSSLYVPRGNVEYAFYLSAKRMAGNLTNLFVGGMYVTAVLLEIPPIFMTKKYLPFLFWYPFGWGDKINENHGIFGALYFHQFFVGAFCSSIENGVDAFLFSSLIFFKYQIQILSYRLSQCGKGTSKKTCHREELLACIKMHVDIKQLIGTFYELLSTVLFVQISQSVIVLAITIVTMILTEINFVILIGKAVYLGILLAEIGLFCYLGDRVYNESVDLPMNAYFCEFIEFDLPTKKIFLFLIHLTGVSPIWIMASGLCKFTLSLPLFLSIIKTTYSSAVFMAKTA